MRAAGDLAARRWLRACGAFAAAVVLAPALAVVLAAAAAPGEALAEGAQIPAELTPADVARYRQIFAVQEAGRWGDADALIADLENPILMGHVRFQRLMHPTDYRSSYAELRDWLSLWADQPDADRIHRLALRRKPSSAAAPRRPAKPDLNGTWRMSVPEQETAAAVTTPVYRPPRSSGQARRVRDAFRHVRAHLRVGEVEHALGDLANGVVINSVFDDTERAILAAEIAAGAFQNGGDALALEMAADAAEKVRQWAPESDWIAGLAAWNLGLYDVARFHFEVAASSGTLGGRELAGAAFWAARANLATHHPEDVVPWLQIAANDPHTLYGQLAARQLGLGPPLEFALPALTAAEVQAVLGVPAVRRAIALSQIGHDTMADREMRALYAAGGLGMAPALLAAAGQHGMASAALRIGRALLNFAGLDYPAALYPLAPWTPESGFNVDRALLHAFMRQESAFNIRALSIDGARGLMQLLPSTASFVAGDTSLMRQNRSRLFSPEYNLELGQRYLRHLLETEGFRDNLMLVVAAYNGGPGNLSRWTRAMGQVDDPLIFMEKVPVRETREFVELVVANLWIYRARMGQQSPTLDSMAANVWPVYRSVDAQIQTASGADPASPRRDPTVFVNARAN